MTFKNTIYYKNFTIVIFLHNFKNTKLNYKLGYVHTVCRSEFLTLTYFMDDLLEKV